jgi:hypothetical protein
MADTGLFIGWGFPIPGREAKAVAVFGESMQYWAGLQQQGKIESFEVGLLDPHGGDLGGFAVLKATPEQIAELRVSPEFQRMVTRAQLIVQSVGVIGVSMGQALAQQMATFQAQLGELA